MKNKEILMKLIKEFLDSQTPLDTEATNKEETTSNWKEKDSHSLIWSYVIVRGYYAGVWAGKLIDPTVGAIILEDARMLRRRWCKKSIGLSGIAEYGINESKKEVRVLANHKLIHITDANVSVFYPCTKEVEKQIREYPVGEQD